MKPVILPILLSYRGLSPEGTAPDPYFAGVTHYALPLKQIDFTQTSTQQLANNGGRSAPDANAYAQGRSAGRCPQAGAHRVEVDFQVLVLHEPPAPFPALEQFTLTTR